MEYRQSVSVLFCLFLCLGGWQQAASRQASSKRVAISHVAVSHHHPQPSTAIHSHPNPLTPLPKYQTTPAQEANHAPIIAHIYSQPHTETVSRNHCTYVRTYVHSSLPIYACDGCLPSCSSYTSSYTSSHTSSHTSSSTPSSFHTPRHHPAPAPPPAQLSTTSALVVSLVTHTIA